MFIVLRGDEELSEVDKVILHALPLLLSESEEFFFCISLQRRRLEGGNKVFLEFFYCHIYISGFREQVRVSPGRVISFHVRERYQDGLPSARHVVKAHQVPLDSSVPTSELGLGPIEGIWLVGN